MQNWTIRNSLPADREHYLQLVTEFYNSDGVDHDIPPQYVENTWAELCRSEDYLVCYLIEQGAELAGYVLLAKNFSQEAGGLTIWLEELYLRPAFRGQGISDALLPWLRRQWEGKAARWRLEVVPSHDRVKALYARHGFAAMPYDQMVLETPL